MVGEEAEQNGRRYGWVEGEKGDGDEDRKERKDRIEEGKELHKSRREVEKKQVGN